MDSQLPHLTLHPDRSGPTAVPAPPACGSAWLPGLWTLGESVRAELQRPSLSSAVRPTLVARLIAQPVSEAKMPLGE